MLSVMIVALTQVKHGSMVIVYTTSYAIFTTNSKATKRSPPDNLGRLVITRSRGLTRKGIEKISRFVRVYVYLVLTPQVEARSSIVGNSVSTADTQEVF